MSERSVSIFVIDSYEDYLGEILEIEEYRTYTNDEAVSYELLKAEAVKALHQELWDNSSREFTRKVIMRLDMGQEDFVVPLSTTNDSVSRIVVVRDTKPTSYLINASDEAQPNPYGIEI